jgi:hypothetical protein
MKHTSALRKKIRALFIKIFSQQSHRRNNLAQSSPHASIWLECLAFFAAKRARWKRNQAVIQQ